MSYSKNCIKCGLPQCKDKIKTDEQGICNICREYSTASSNIKLNSVDNLSKEERRQILNNKVQKHVKHCTNPKYNCVVAVSGGKDSLMALYVAKKELGLNPVGFFIDNGFAIDEMKENIDNASKILGVDIVTFKTEYLKGLFRVLLKSKKEIYYCRVCHLLIDLYVKRFCKENNISLLLGGYTKGQAYISKNELFWIYSISDSNTIEALENYPEYEEVVDIVKNPLIYFAKNFKDIEQISPFKYIDYSEEEIIKFLEQNIKFKVPKHSWPQNSTNCRFNYLSQFLARKQFGYSQHEVEIATLVREKEMTLQHATRILNTPITDDDISDVLNVLDLNRSDIGIE